MGRQHERAGDPLGKGVLKSSALFCVEKVEQNVGRYCGLDSDDASRERRRIKVSRLLAARGVE